MTRMQLALRVARSLELPLNASQLAPPRYAATSATVAYVAAKSGNTYRRKGGFLVGYAADGTDV